MKNYRVNYFCANCHFSVIGDDGKMFCNCDSDMPRTRFDDDKEMEKSWRKWSLKHEVNKFGTCDNWMNNKVWIKS